MSDVSEETNLPDFDDIEKLDTEVLGKQTEIPADPEAFQLHCVTNEDHPRIFNARFTVPEFTSLCPITGQPDHAIIVIDYIPQRLLIESKSLKLYMFSFRNHGAYHERVTNMIGKKLYTAAKPKWLQVSAYFNPRGGIPIDVVCPFGVFPENISKDFIPPHNIPVYSGR